MACLNVVVLVVLAAAMVQASGEHAAPPPTPPPTQDPRIQLEQINCEVAVNTAVADENRIADEIVKAKSMMATTQLALEKAKVEYAKAEQDASRDESVQFGMRYLKLKQEMAALKQEVLDDNANKLNYVEMVAKLPLIQQEIETTQSQHQVLFKEVASTKRAIVANEEELMIGKKKLAALQGELPAKREVLDQKFARPIIKTKASIAELQIKLKDTEKGAKEMETRTMPLANELKNVRAKETLLETEDSKLNAELKATQQKTVDTAKANAVTETELTEELASQRAKSGGAANNAASNDESANAADANSKLQMDELKAKQKGEAQVEEVEKEGDHESLALKVVKQEHAQLRADLNRITEGTNARQATAAENAARELAAVKARYGEKLEIVKKSHESAKHSKSTATRGSADATDKTAAMEAKLRAAVPTIEP